MEKFFALQKFDERTGLTTGIMAAELPDSDGEEMDYFGGGKAAIQSWSDRCAASTRAAGQELSLGNIRVQHDPSKIGGKAVSITYDDVAKSITLTSQPVNAEVRDMILKGYLRGYSICGNYQSRNCSECGADMMSTMAARTNLCPQCKKRVIVKYVPDVVETSFVDAPALKEAVFTIVKSDGTEVSQRFSKGVTMTLKEHLLSEASDQKEWSKCKSAHSNTHLQAAKSAEGRGDPAAVKFHKSEAATFAKEASLIDNHVARLGALVSGGPEVWDLSQWTVDDEGSPVNGPDKVAKSGSDFFTKFLYGGRSPADMLSAPPHQNPADLFR
jgi:DNA-directed RNA polymerase subunit RPC12/RpoP